MECLWFSDAVVFLLAQANRLQRLQFQLKSRQLSLSATSGTQRTRNREERKAPILREMLDPPSTRATKFRTRTHDTTCLVGVRRCLLASLIHHSYPNYKNCDLAANISRAVFMVSHAKSEQHYHCSCQSLATIYKAADLPNRCMECPHGLKGLQLCRV